jgi:hypothetical protein
VVILRLLNRHPLREGWREVSRLLHHYHCLHRCCQAAYHRLGGLLRPLDLCPGLYLYLADPRPDPLDLVCTCRFDSCQPWP